MTCVFFPNRLDSYAPIPTIYREIGRRISYDVCAFVGPNPSEDINLGDINTITIQGAKWQRGLKYLQNHVTDCDIVHTSARYSPLSLVLRPITGAKVVFTLHNAEELGSMDWYFHLYRYLMTAFSDCVSVVSPFIADVVRQRYRIEPTVIPNGVDMELYRPDQADTQTSSFLFIGRGIDRKNPEFVATLAQHRPKYEFIFRTNDLDDDLRLAIDSIPNINIMSTLSETELAQLYARSAATLCPFEREGFGMVVIESLASGTPVIGLNDGNIPHLINHGSNGVLCEGLETEEWLTALDTIHRNPDRFQARSNVEQYSWDCVAKQYESLYDEIIA